MKIFRLNLKLKDSGIELLKERSIKGRRIFLVRDFTIITPYANRIHRCGNLLLLKGGSHHGWVYSKDNLSVFSKPV